MLGIEDLYQGEEVTDEEFLRGLRAIVGIVDTLPKEQGLKFLREAMALLNEKAREVGRRD